MKITIELQGTSPLLMHNPQMVDPQFEINRQIKLLTAKRKKTNEDLAQIERLEWYGGIYTMTNGNGKATVMQPTSKVRKCIINAAKISKLGKAIERAVAFSALNVPLVYDGPADIDELYADKRYHSRLSVGIGKKRIIRVRPQFLPWALSVGGIFTEDAGINFDEFVGIVELAGVVEGIGDNRVNGYGRFTAQVLTK